MSRLQFNIYNNDDLFKNILIHWTFTIDSTINCRQTLGVLNILPSPLQLYCDLCLVSNGAIWLWGLWTPTLVRFFDSVLIVRFGFLG